MGGKIPRLAQVAGKRHDHRIAAEQQPDLLVAALRIEILIDRGVTEPRRVVARIGAHHGEEAVQKGYLLRLWHDQFSPPVFASRQTLIFAKASPSRGGSTHPAATGSARIDPRAGTIRRRSSCRLPGDAGARAPNRSPARLRVAGRIHAPFSNHHQVPTTALASQAPHLPPPPYPPPPSATHRPSSL